MRSKFVNAPAGIYYYEVMPDISRKELQSFIKDLSYRRVAYLASAFIVIGAVFYHLVEKFTWLDSFYFTFVTLATVGYGDFTPKTAAGKIFTMFYVLFGITIFIILAKVVLAGVAIRTNNNRKSK